MSHFTYSDLPFGTESELIIVVQPEHTLGMSREDFLKKEDDFLRQMFRNALTFRGLHAIGMLRCYLYDAVNIGKPTHFEPWDARLNMEPMPRAAPYWLRERGDTLIFCERPDGRNTQLVMSWLATMDIADIMFHLMMKQMVPSLHTCNWVDCNRWERNLLIDQSVTEGEAQRIQGLGFMSVASQCFWGDIGGWERFMSPHRCSFSLGFVLMPGMDTREGCDGFDKWLRFLIEEKYARDVKHHDSQLACIVGPQPRSRR